MKTRRLPPEKQLLADQIAAFLQSREKILFAYVYGSFVREEKFADIDIAVFVKDPACLNLLDFELEMETALHSLLRFSVDLRVLNFAPVSFVYNVTKESVLIIDKAPDLRADFEGKIFKKYFDFAPYRKRYLKEVPDAPL